MKRSEITEAFVKKVGQGIREYNRNSPPLEISICKDGKHCPTASQKEKADARWLDAVRYGLLEAAHN